MENEEKVNEHVYVKSDDFIIHKNIGEFSNMIFGIETVYDPIITHEQINFGSDIPRVSINMVSFVRMASLSKELCDRIREELDIPNKEIGYDMR